MHFLGEKQFPYLSGDNSVFDNNSMLEKYWCTLNIVFTHMSLYLEHRQLWSSARPFIHPLRSTHSQLITICHFFFFFPEKLTGCFSERVHQCFQKVHFIPSPSDAASWPQPCYKRWSDIPIFQEKGCTSSPSDFALKSKGAASTALCAEAVPVCCSLLVKSTK